MNSSSLPDVCVRLATPADRDFLIRMAPRLLAGYAPWRDADRMLSTMEGFLIENLETSPEKGAMFIAQRSDGTPLGVVSVADHTNFTGERQAYLGELAVLEEAEGHGIGRVLVGAAERWAQDRGHTLLVLETGAANARARDFYARLGYQEESVRLVRLLDSPEVA